MFGFLLLAAFYPAFTGDTGQDTAKGASLARGCQAELRLMAPHGLQSASQEDLINGAYCIGYVNGFVSNSTAVQPTICPAEQPMVALVQAYVNYMGSNPNLLEEDKRVGLRLALESAFPCRIAGKVSGTTVLSRRDQL